jgi:uncharacterized protein (TIGR02611 family)
VGIALENSIEEWRRFLKEGAPGGRFRDRYRRQHCNHERSTLRRACYASFGLAIVIGSLVLAPLPGPGWGTFFVGLGILSGEVLYVARLLDRTEVKLRESLRRAKCVWGQSALALRMMITLTLTSGVAASAYGAYLVSLRLLTIPSG